MKNRTVSATEFKAKCLALLDEVGERSETITVTKRGKPVAVVSPAPKKKWKSLAGSLATKGKIVGDIINIDPYELYEVVRDPDSVLNPESRRS